MRRSLREYLDTSSRGLYYAYSFERTLCKSGLENRFLIAARKKSGDFARRVHLRPKRVARVRLGELHGNRISFYYNLRVTKC